MLVVSLIQLRRSPGGPARSAGTLVSVGLLSVVGHLVALIMFFPDAPGIAVALLALDLIVALCLLALVRSARSVAT